MQLSKICIVIPYFGKWPFWINFFLASCRENATVNWLIYTDCGVPESLPSNVKLIDISYKKYCALVSTMLGINFKPTNPYKLCDIKPALGLIHESELADFDFWAFGDLDLVYGNLRKYYTEQRLDEKEVFSTHKTRISGHLCLLRNTAELRNAFKKISDWELKFIHQEHLALDEKDFSRIFLRHKNSPNWVKRLAALRDSWLSIAEFNEAYTTPNGRIPWIDGSFNFPTSWSWRSGQLDVIGFEAKCFPYFHFLIWKNNWLNSDYGKHVAKSLIDKSQKDLNYFTITQNGFHE